MQTFGFLPPNDKDEFPFAPPVAESMTRLYHGTSTHFRSRIEHHGFLLSYRVVTEWQHKLLELYAPLMPRLGANGVWALSASKRLNLAEKCSLAIEYASGTLKGGVARSLHDDLASLLDLKDSRVSDDHRSILEALRVELAPVVNAPGIVYAVDFSESDCDRLQDRSGGLAHAPFDVLPERISFGVVIS